MTLSSTHILNVYKKKLNNKNFSQKIEVITKDHSRVKARDDGSMEIAALLVKDSSILWMFNIFSSYLLRS